MRLEFCLKYFKFEHHLCVSSENYILRKKKKDNQTLKDNFTFVFIYSTTIAINVKFVVSDFRKNKTIKRYVVTRWNFKWIEADIFFKKKEKRKNCVVP